VLSAIFLLVLSAGAIAAGAGYIRTSDRMRSFAVTRGTVIARDVQIISTLGGPPAARWGKGGGYAPKVTYTYEVGGVAFTSDRWTYAQRGLRESLARQQADDLPDEVDVHYDPANPREAYLETHSPKLGRWLVVGGIAGLLLAALVALV
jgi:hypothetical protein